MDYQDPKHLQSFDQPCEACGAEWEHDNKYDSTMVMNHGQLCAYLESHEYGGTKELIDDGHERGE